MTLTALEAHLVPLQSTGYSLLGCVYGLAAFRTLGVVCWFERHCARLTYPATKHRQVKHNYRLLHRSYRGYGGEGDLKIGTASRTNNLKHFDRPVVTLIFIKICYLQTNIH